MKVPRCATDDTAFKICIKEEPFPLSAILSEAPLRSVKIAITSDSDAGCPKRDGS